MSEAATLPTEISAAPTPLAAYLQIANPDLALKPYAGALTPVAFSARTLELGLAVTGRAFFDLGYRTRIRITGPDRVRWLNGMVSNAIQTLELNHGNYNFILNAQGKIQGDAYIYRTANSLLLDTDRSQAGRLLARLDHFIIMDDVELERLDDTTTGIAVIGPDAPAILARFGIDVASLLPLQFAEATLTDAPITVVRAYSVLVPRYELWFDPKYIAQIWPAINMSGAYPIGVDTVEAIRVLEGIPRYGTDITDKHLAQETSQTRALNFTKGCYLGQEIVERIRSRATVHRNLRQFVLRGKKPATPADLRVQGEATAVGQLSSIATVDIPGFKETLAVGFLRNEALERKLPLEYDGGTATVLDTPPRLS